MTLHTVGPENMGDDERSIGRAYQTWLFIPLMLGPAVAASFFPAEKVAFVCVGLALALLHEAGGRLHDLCIRLRRTNILLRERGSETRAP